MGKLNKKNAGFSLLEVILSMAILAIISIPLLKYFTDSMRYNAMMAQKQKATLLAQEKTESLKAEEKLIAIPDGGTQYTVSCLDSLGYTTTDSFDAEGKGSVTYTGTEGNYDVVVTLSTTVSANSVTRPILYGIDDKTDVLAVERDQKKEAVSYFMAINSAYVERNGGTLLSSTQVENALSRVIQVEIGKDGANYTVKLYYDYTAVGMRGDSSPDYWTGSYLLDVKIAQLNKIYLLYDKMSGASGSKPDTLNVTVKVDSYDTADANLSPELYLICQNVTDDSAYRLTVARYLWITGDASASDLDIPTVHTNIDPVRNGTNSGQVLDKNGNRITNTLPLTEDGKPVRLISIETGIYEKGGYAAGEEPLAVVNTTKGE